VFKNTFYSLKIRNFKLFFIGQVISVSGTWAQSFAQGWLVLSLTKNNAFDLGITTGCQFLPILFLGPWGGLIADRYEKRTILFFTQSISAVEAAALGILVLKNDVNFITVTIFAFLLGMVNVFDNPARQSFVLEMVGKEYVSNAVSLNSVLVNLARVVGPGVSGILIETLGIGYSFIFNAFSFIAVLFALYLMKKSELHSTQPVAKMKHQLRQGFSYVYKVKDLYVPLVLMAVIGTLAYNFQVTLLLFAKQTFKLGAGGSGLFFTVMGLGAIGGGLVVANRKAPTNKSFLFVAFIFGLLLTVLSWTPNVVLAYIILVPMGGFSIAYIAQSNTLLQIRSKPEYRGRVMSLYSVAFLGSTPVGALIVSWVASVSNPRVSILLGGIATVVAVTVAFFILNIKISSTQSYS
jgi:MFS family permease